VSAAELQAQKRAALASMPAFGGAPASRPGSASAAAPSSTFPVVQQPPATTAADSPFAGQAGSQSSIFGRLSSPAAAPAAAAPDSDAAAKLRRTQRFGPSLQEAGAEDRGAAALPAPAAQPIQEQPMGGEEDAMAADDDGEGWLFP
jgi:hypothetical protein